MGLFGPHWSPLQHLDLRRAEYIHLVPTESRMMVEAEAKRLPVEPHGPDFPFYRDTPPTISPSGWLLVLAALPVGFAALSLPLPFEDGVLSGWIRVAFFVSLPLFALRLAAPSRWRAIFGSVGLREIRLMMGFALLNIIVSMAVGAAVSAWGTVTPNAAIAGAADLDGPHLVSFFAKVGLQLIGEELITILPFLALLSLCHAMFGLGRSAAVLLAWLVSAIGFGLIHLPTYDWNVVQCVVIIGSARLVLTWAYIWSKNIWVSTGAHILNDWALIAMPLVLTPLVVNS
jgi:uncharacterized protein